MKKLVMTLLMLCMVVGLCACGTPNDTESGNSESGVESTKPSESESEKTPVDDGKVAYTVKIVDQNGNPVEGVRVQWCLEMCVPSKASDASGIATPMAGKLEKADYKVTVTTLPDGYTAADMAQEYHYEGDATELTITVQKAAQ